jgi:hypothetical protein
MFEYMDKLMEKCFNDIDNSVKMVCCGENGSIPNIQNGIETLN